MSYQAPNPNGSTTSVNSSPVVIASDQTSVPITQNAATVPAVVTMQSAVVANGNGSVLTVTGYATAIVQITSSPAMSGGTTVNFEISADAGTTWVSVLTHQIGIAGSLVSTTTADGDFRVNCAGFAQVRARISGYSAGTVTVKGYATPAAGTPTTVSIAAGTSKMGTVTTDQTTHGTTDLVAADLTKIAGTAVDVNSGSKSAGTQRVIIATDQPALTTAMPVALAAGAAKVGVVTTDQTTHGTTDLVAADLTKIAGTATDVNSGTKSAGTQRVVIATDQPSLTNALSVGGDVASGSSDSGNPAKIGGIAKTANPTAVADGQRVGATFDKVGKQVVVGSIRALKGNQTSVITSSTAEATIVTADATNFLDVYGLLLTNTSATDTEVTIKDATSGTTRFSIMAPAGKNAGFMLPESAAVTQAVVNNNWTATCVTSVASLKITALFVRNL